MPARSKESRKLHGGAADGGEVASPGTWVHNGAQGRDEQDCPVVEIIPKLLGSKATPEFQLRKREKKELSCPLPRTLEKWR